MKKPKWTEYLPAWAKYNPKAKPLENKDGKLFHPVEVEANVVYPLWLEKMEKLDPMLMGISTKITQHTLEAARYTFTRYLKKIMYDHGGNFLYLKILAGKDKKWALTKYRAGVPIDRSKVKIKLGLDARLG